MDPRSEFDTTDPLHYIFEEPSEEPDPELLALLPKKTLLERVVDFGLYFVAAFQVICILALIFLKEPDQSKETEREIEETKPELNSKPDAGQSKRSKKKETKKNK